MKIIIRYGIAIVMCYTSLYIATLFFETTAAGWYTYLGSYAWHPLPLTILLPLILIVYGLAALSIGRLWSTTSFWHAWVSCAFLTLFFAAAWLLFLIGYHAVFISLAMIICLYMILVPLILSAWEIDKLAFYLFIPFFLWSTYALYFTAAAYMGMGW
jgi:tryptophan-rich sensory protein